MIHWVLGSSFPRIGEKHRPVTLDSPKLSLGHPVPNSQWDPQCAPSLARGTAEPHVPPQPLGDQKRKVMSPGTALPERWKRILVLNSG